MKNEAKSKAMLGNNNGTKLKTPELRQKAYKAYCDWIADGWPKQSFFFEDGDACACWATLDKYIEDNPSEFDPFLMKKAQAKRFQHWLEAGNKLMNGKVKGGSPVIWMINMRNRFKDYGWDAETKESPKASEQVQFALAEAKGLDGKD